MYEQNPLDQCEMTADGWTISSIGDDQHQPVDQDPCDGVRDRGAQEVSILSPLNIAFIAGLSDHKLAQFLEPLLVIPQVESITLYRRNPFDINELFNRARYADDASIASPLHDPVRARGKIKQAYMPRWMISRPLVAELWRLLMLLLGGFRHDMAIGCHQNMHGVWAWLWGVFTRQPVVQLVITDVPWVVDRPVMKRAMLAAAACGVMGGNSRCNLRNIGYGQAIEIITLPWPNQSAATEENQKRHDLIAVAGYALEKDYPWMLEVLRALKQRRKNFSLLICGAGVKEQFSEQIARYGLTEHIHFSGLVDNQALGDLYHSSRALIMTSYCEGLPMVVVEALSYGLPALVTDVGDNSWLVRDGHDGRIIPHGDTEAFVEALDSLLDRPEELAHMGKSAHGRMHTFSEWFKLEDIAIRWQRLLASALEESH